MASRRLASIDVLRAIAIMLMVQVHFLENLASGEEFPRVHDLSHALGLLAAPLFTFLTGLSLWLWLKKAGAAVEPLR